MVAAGSHIESRTASNGAGDTLASEPVSGKLLRAPVSPLPPNTGFVDLLDVSYAHLRTSDGGDLYLTTHGQRFWEHLLPENWQGPAYSFI